MKYYFLCFAFLFCFSSLHAQKQTTIKRTNVKVVNQKLVLLQATVKRLQTKLIEAKTIMSQLQIQIDAINDLNSNDMLQMQQVMERKSELEQLISDMIKACYEAGQNIAPNLK